MNIGYACLGIAIPGSKMKSTILKNAITERLLSLIEHNLNALESMIDYNIENGVKLFRISSDLIPFGSSVAAEQAVDRLIPLYRPRFQFIPLNCMSCSELLLESLLHCGRQKDLN